jgi:DNA-binding response OmpR family regulator
MDRPLVGRVVLVIEDEPLIALEIRQAFEEAGAAVEVARTVSAALVAVEAAAVTAAIVDHGLPDGDSEAICNRLSERNIPFVTYSGYPNSVGARSAGEHINKPADGSLLVATVMGLLGRQPNSN